MFVCIHCSYTFAYLSQLARARLGCNTHGARPSMKLGDIRLRILDVSPSLELINMLAAVGAIGLRAAAVVVLRDGLEELEL